MRSSKGAQLAEFGPALMLLFFLIVLPLVDLAAIPIRTIYAQNLVNDFTRRAALCEKFSEVNTLVKNEPSLKSRLESVGGIKLKNVEIHLLINSAGEPTIIKNVGEIAPILLPNNSKLTASYDLELHVSLSVSALFTLPFKFVTVPGATAPLNLALSAAHRWENRGIDPRTHQFYMNE